MTTVQKTQSQQPGKNKPIFSSSTPSRGQYKNAAPLGNQTFLFDRGNYMWMFGGIALILIGFMLMAGGKSPNPHEFLYDEIYSFRRITLAPIILLLGFAVEVYAIMKKPVDRATVITTDRPATDA